MKPVFVHISKNAGTSIVRSAGDQIIVAGHRTAASWVAEHGRHAPLFAVVRNPYDRVVSEYCYRRRRFESGERNPHLGNLALAFDEWVSATFEAGRFRTLEDFERTGVSFNPANMVDGSLIWFAGQTRWLCDEGGQLLADHILRFEHLADEWRRFASAYRIDAPLVHANASPVSAAVLDRFDQRTRDIVYDFYRDDFETFGYER